MSPEGSFQGLRVSAILIVFCFLFVPGKSLAQQKIVGYYASWNSGKLPYNEIEYSNLTDIIVAFGTPNSDGSLSFDSGIPFPQLVSAAHSAGVKVLISLGGASSGASFASATGDSALRAVLISNIVNFLEKNNYDGVDIDWETPSNATQADNLDSLVEDMRSAFDSKDSSWLITMAIPATSSGGQNFDFVTLVNYVDWFNIMCYDFVGSWSGYAGFNAPLYQVADDPNQAGSDSTAISYWLSRGTYYVNRQLVHVDIPTNKLVLGVPFYGDQFNAVGLYQKLTNTNVTNTTYPDIVNDLASGWTYHWYEATEEPFLVNSDSTEFITYEDTNSVKAKTEFSIRQGLGGIMIWELSQDLYNGRQPLLEAAAKAIREVTAVELRPQIAAGFRLYGNYPNPFNPTTVIAYQLSTASRVTLKVYDVLGRIIATLVDARQGPGNHTAAFGGTQLPSGVYFYVLRAGGESATGKMILLK